MKTSYKIGQRIQAYINCNNEIIDGIIVSIGIHKGRTAYNLDNNRFVYDSQIWGNY